MKSKNSFARQCAKSGRIFFLPQGEKEETFQGHTELLSIGIKLSQSVLLNIET